MKKLSLYIHIPFCVRKCLYCDFLSFSAEDAVKEAYVDSLLNEFVSYKKWLVSEKVIFKSVFIGGGTPTCLSPEMLLKIGKAINEFTDGNTEFTIEANPGTILDTHIKAFKEIGINRVSIGLQSAQNDELKKLGRIHTYEEFLESYKKLVKAHFDNINIDLMADIPGQTAESYKDTLNKVISLKPQHISAYSLIIEPGTSFFEMQENGMLNIADEDTDRLMYQFTKEILGEHGYNRYEISNYSMEGKECVHNIVYWTCEEYLGIGLGAASYINGVRFANIRGIDKYISKYKNIQYIETISKYDSIYNRDVVCGISRLSDFNKMEEFMFLGLRMTSGVSKQEFIKRFNRHIEDVYGDVIKYFLENNLLAEGANSDKIYLTDRGIDVSNRILSEFLLDNDE